MKKLLLTAAVTLWVGTTGAFAQDACQNFYGECMDRCVKKQSGGGDCSQVCESQSNTCYEKVFGKAKSDGPASYPDAAGSSSDAQDARGEATNVKPDAKSELKAESKGKSKVEKKKTEKKSEPKT